MTSVRVPAAGISDAAATVAVQSHLDMVCEVEPHVAHDCYSDPIRPRRAGDLICRTYLGSGKRVIDAGSPEMNMAVIHVLGRLYRETGEGRYLPGQ